MIRAVAAVGLAAVVAGCSSSGGGASTATSSFTPDLPPTVAPQTGPTTPEPPPAAAPAPVGKTVPARALLAPADLGAGWSRTAPAAVGCSSGLPAAPSRTAAMRDARGTLTETVSLPGDVPRAVAAWGRALRRCGWSVSDYRLGDAGLVAHGRSATVVVTGTEGVLVLLHVGGSLAGSSDDIDSWADMALGTSCEAAADGCH